eukprot:533186-Hanusia_phi.AAC.1
MNCGTALAPAATLQGERAGGSDSISASDLTRPGEVRARLKLSRKKILGRIELGTCHDHH